jgi:hypothetical protein
MDECGVVPSRCSSRMSESAESPFGHPKITFHGSQPYFFPALTFAHRARCAAAIRFLPAADIFRRRVLVCFVTFCFALPSSNRNT